MDKACTYSTTVEPTDIGTKWRYSDINHCVIFCTFRKMIKIAGEENESWKWLVRNGGAEVQF